jgi:hypothetical protein
VHGPTCIFWANLLVTPFSLRFDANFASAEFNTKVLGISIQSLLGRWTFPQSMDGGAFPCPIRICYRGAVRRWATFTAFDLTRWRCAGTKLERCTWGQDESKWADKTEAHCYYPVQLAGEKPDASAIARFKEAWGSTTVYRMV